MKQQYQILPTDCHCYPTDVVKSLYYHAAQYNHIVHIAQQRQKKILELKRHPISPLADE